jgi:hypothetical protein
MPNGQLPQVRHEAGQKSSAAPLKIGAPGFAGRKYISRMQTNVASQTVRFILIL